MDSGYYICKVVLFYNIPLNCYKIVASVPAAKLIVFVVLTEYSYLNSETQRSLKNLIIVWFLVNSLI